jgi:hypothetical protein
MRLADPLDAALGRRDDVLLNWSADASVAEPMSQSDDGRRTLWIRRL